MNVIQGNNLNAAERNFNNAIRSIRQIIERVIGVLKIRFRCILGERQLRYHQTKSSNIIYACATLHNFLLFNRYDIFRNIDENELQHVINVNNDNQQINVVANRRNGVRLRNELVAMFQ